MKSPGASDIDRIALRRGSAYRRVPARGTDAPVLREHEPTTHL